MKTLILSPNYSGIFSSEQQNEIERQGGQVYKDPLPFDQISELSGSEDIILALDPDFCNWSVTAEDIKKWTAVRAICLQTTGFGWIDTQACLRQGIPVVNLRGFSTNAVAEFYQFITIGVMRRIALLAQDGYKQDFIKHQGVEILGKKVGIIGLGNIGRHYGELLVGGGAQVQYWSKNARDERFVYVSLEELYTTSDIIFISIAVHDTIEKLFTPELLAKLKSSVTIIRVTHSIPAHDTFLELAKIGKIYGYGFEQDDAVLGSHPGNVFSISKIGWATEECMQRNGVLWLEAIRQAKVGNFPTQVN